MKRLDKIKTSFVKKIIELYYDKLDEMVADKRIDNLKSGKSTVVPLEEVFKKAKFDEKVLKEDFLNALSQVPDNEAFRNDKL